MTSKDIKINMLAHMLYRLHYIAAVTEYGGMGVNGVADLFGIIESGFTHEFEVKVGRSDLMGELVAIKYHLTDKALFGPENPAPTNMTKSHKHGNYLKGEEEKYFIYRQSRPNKFSYVVTEELLPLARERLEKTPYGLFVVDNKTDVKCIKRATFLHKEPANQMLRNNLMRKACIELQSVRYDLRVLQTTGKMPTRIEP